MDVRWSNSLGTLADALFAGMETARAASPGEVLGRRRCVVVPNRIHQCWLQHRFLYRDRDNALPRVLANVEFPLLNIFVNDWLHRMNHPADSRRDPATHPFARESLQWRIHQVLTDPALKKDAAFSPLSAYLASAGDRPKQAARRRFQFAGRLATLFDEYTVYRPEMMADWEAGRLGRLPENMRWQPALWQRLTQGKLRSETYLAAFHDMKDKLRNCRIPSEYDHIHVFGVSMMPRVYSVFFHLLSELVPVSLYVFNPCREHWSDQLTPRQEEKERAQLRLEGREDPDVLLQAPNPILAANGRGCRDFLSELLDLTDGQIEEAPGFEDPGTDTVLHAVQSAILADEPKADTSARADTTVQVHVCHSPMREVEVLKDQLLRWFTADPTLQPRHVQVQVADMAVYAPLIDAVFSASDRDAADTIPYVIADRVRGAESGVAGTFLSLLELGESRLAAPDVMELLQCESLREAFGLTDEDVAALSGWLQEAGIRWGWDPAHRREAVKVEFTGMTTWRYGLDRLLLGYAMGAESSAAPEGATERLIPCDQVEGDRARVLGRMMRFMDALRSAADDATKEFTPLDWTDKLDELVTVFFRSTNATYRDVGVLRAAVESLRKGAAAAGLDPAHTVPVAVIREYLASHLAGATGGEDLVGNAVVFSALRTGSSTPRRVMALLGLGDTQFPRAVNRPAYDLFRSLHRRGDRSPRIEDRMGFLEALVCTGEYLHLSYAGRSLTDDSVIPPSVLVKELCEAPGLRDEPGRVALLRHRMQTFHPAYFQKGDEHFSYSVSDCMAARVLAGGPASETSRVTVSVAPAPVPVEEAAIELDDLIRFFKNPAEDYYRHVLGARLDPPSEGVLGDSEEFELDGLTAFRVNSAIVEGLLADPARGTDAVYRALAAQGLVPLEQWGRGWFAEQWKEIEAILDLPRLDNNTSLADALRHQSRRQPVFRTLELGKGLRLTGKTVAGESREEFLHVDFRCAKPRATPTIGSWLRHLFACANALCERRYSFQGKNGEDLDRVVFPPLAEEEAGAQLRSYVEQHLAGRGRVLPFAPETSCAFVVAYRKKAATHAPDAACTEAGLTAARRAWGPDAYRGGEGNDIHLAAEFGVEGPMSRMPEFGELARKLLDPLLTSAEAGEEDVHG